MYVSKQNSFEFFKRNNIELGMEKIGPKTILKLKKKLIDQSSLL